MEKFTKQNIFIDGKARIAIALNNFFYFFFLSFQSLKYNYLQSRKLSTIYHKKNLNNYTFKMFLSIDIFDQREA